MLNPDQIQHLIFDLDGTISNPEMGIFNAYRYAFKEMRLPAPPDNLLKQYVGPPLRSVFGTYFNFEEEKINAAIQAYRHYYIEQEGMFENNLFDGMFHFLENLKMKGKSLYVATFKGASVDVILKHFGIFSFFDRIEFYNEPAGITTKERMIENIMHAHEISDKEQVVMIGDREHDILAAHETGVKSCAVTYGFGSIEELVKSKPNFLVNSVNELSGLFL